MIWQMVISAEKKNKAGKRDRVCCWRGQVAILSGMVRKCLLEQVTSTQRSERGKGMSHGDHWGRAEGTSERSLGGNVLGVLHEPQENHMTRAGSEGESHRK